MLTRLLKSWPRRRDPLRRHPSTCELFAVILMIAAGCARFDPKPLSPSASLARLEGLSLTNVALRSFLEEQLHRELEGWPSVTWNFEMLTLAALYYHTDLMVARAQWATARGAEITAAQRPNPSLTVTPGYDSTTLTPSPWIPLGFVDIPIETAGKRRFRRAQAAGHAEAARLQLAIAAWQVRSRLRASLIDYDTDSRKGALLQQQLSVQEHIVQLSEQQVTAGAIAPSQLLPARIGLIKLRLDLADAQRTRAEARGRLAEAIGIPGQALDETKFSLE